MQEGTNIVKEKEKKEAFQKTCYKKYVLNYALKQNPYAIFEEMLRFWQTDFAHMELTEYLLQAYSGVKTLKNRISRLKKQIRGLEKKGGGGTAPLKAEAEKLQKCLPEDKAVSIKNLELVKRNSGLVYMPSHIQYPA